MFEKRSENQLLPGKLCILAMHNPVDFTQALIKNIIFINQVFVGFLMFPTGIRF